MNLIRHITGLGTRSKYFHAGAGKTATTNRRKQATMKSQILILTIALLSLAQRANADSSFETGATWQISLNNGGSYGAPDATSTRTLPDGDSVTGIAGGNPFNITDRYYRNIFNLSELTASAKTQFATNDLFELLVNGNSVDLTAVVNGSTLNTSDQSPVTGLPIPGAYFQLGSNEILFKTHSFTGGSAGDPFLAARVDLTVPEPASLSLLALGGATLLRRRQRIV